MSSRFQGLSALLQTRRRAVLAFFWAGLLLSLGVGIADRLGYLVDTRPAMMMLGLGLIGVLPPFVMAGELTFRSTPGGRSFRESMLAGPLGSMAIPAMIQIAALAAMVAATLGAVPGLLVSTVEFDRVLLLVTGANLLGFWAIFSLVASFGNHTVSAVVLLLIPPLLWLVAPFGAGYGEDQAIAIFAWLIANLVVLGGLILALPYLVYSRPRHHWADEVGFEVESGRDLGVWLLVGAFCFVPYLSLIWTLPMIAIALAVHVRFRPQPGPRARLGHFQFGARVCLIAFLPIMIFGLIGDAYYMHTSATYDAERHPHGVDAPVGGRRAVILAEAVSGISPLRSSSEADRLISLEGLGRVVVLDAAGQVEVVFPQRFGVIERASWSADGRYLAVHDQDMGVIQGDLPLRVTQVLVSTSGLRQRLGRLFGQCVQATYVLDTQTGELQRMPLLELRPGWTRPEQLVRHELGFGGQHVLADGQGNAAETHERVHVKRYTSAGAVLSSKDGGDLVFGQGGLRPLRE
tara:strand:+ start:969 stop:2525 length:1557 start_codon:yes stop_codon:yes gene_type:complete